MQAEIQKVLNLSSNLASLITFIFGKSKLGIWVRNCTFIMSIGAIVGSKHFILKGNKFIRPMFFNFMLSFLY